jgi:glucose/mannose-6-phosphate isomerase
MIDLNNIEEIKRLDPQDTIGSTEKLADQMEAAWHQVQNIEVPADYSSVSNIVFCGMGASIYGALVFKALAGENNKYPTEYVSDYHLPKFVNNNTLVVLTSYSGTTEEVLSCAHEALEMGAKMHILTKGGPLSEFAKEHNIPSYIFDGVLNPAGVPRLGNGYTILGLRQIYKKGYCALSQIQKVALPLSG